MPCGPRPLQHLARDMRRLCANRQDTSSADEAVWKSSHVINLPSGIDPHLGPVQGLHQTVDLIIEPAVREAHELVDVGLNPTVFTLFVDYIHTPIKKNRKHDGRSRLLVMFWAIAKTGYAGLNQILNKGNTAA